MFNFLRKKTSPRELAAVLYFGCVERCAEAPLIDSDGNTILDEHEKRLLMLANLCAILKHRNLKNVELQLMAVFISDTKNSKSELSPPIEMFLLSASIDKINVFFKKRPTKEVHELLTEPWIFERTLNPVQKTKALGWCSAFLPPAKKIIESTLSKLRVIDE